MLVCAIGDFLRFAQAASDFVDRHSNGYFVSCDESVDNVPALLAFLQVSQETFRERFDLVVRNPGGNSALLGVAADSAPIVSKCFYLHDLRETQGARVARHADVEIARRRTENS